MAGILHLQVFPELMTRTPVFFIPCETASLHAVKVHCKSTVSRVQILMFKLDWQPKKLNEIESITIWLQNLRSNLDCWKHPYKLAGKPQSHWKGQKGWTNQSHLIRNIQITEFKKKLPEKKVWKLFRVSE